MKTIWKFPLEITDVQEIEMPHGAQVLTAQMQGMQLCVWAMVDDAIAATEKRAFWVHGTGNPIKYAGELGRYIGAVQMHSGMLIWHVFEGK